MDRQRVADDDRDGLMHRVAASVAFALFLCAGPVRADYREFASVRIEPRLEERLRESAAEVLRQYPKLTRENLAISVVDFTDPEASVRGDFNGGAPFYPASVVKLFFMVDAYAQHRENMPDMPRALKEMIVVSDNDATAYVVDVLSGVAAGPELQGRALRKFVEARRMTNRTFQRLGYDVSAMMKPWSFAPYGREMQLIGPDRVNRNRATANGVASLMLWVARRRAVSPAASDAMLALMQRPLDPVRPDENQVKEFIGEALPANAKLWSKAGWTSEVRHDAAYVELPGGRRYVIVVFTRGLGDDVTIVPTVTRAVLSRL